MKRVSPIIQNLSTGKYLESRSSLLTNRFIAFCRYCTTQLCTVLPLSIAFIIFVVSKVPIICKESLLNIDRTNLGQTSGKTKIWYLKGKDAEYVKNATRLNIPKIGQKNNQYVAEKFSNGECCRIFSGRNITNFKTVKLD